MTPEEYRSKLQAWNAKHEKTLSAMDDWHCRRMSGVGGSEIAAVMGKNKYKTPHQLWLEKTLKVPPFSGNAATLKGNILEDAVAKFYEDATSNTVEIDTTHYRSEDAPWLCGNIDRKIIGGGILECKTTRRNPSDDETEDGYQWGMGNEYDESKQLVATDEQIPLNYYLQVQHYMCLTGADFADVAVLFLADDFKPFRVYRIERNEEVIEKIKASAHDFMLMVLDDAEPPMTDAEQAQNLAHTVSVSESVEVGKKVIEQLRKVRAELKLLEEEEKLLTDQIKAKLGDADTGTVGGKVAVTWKTRGVTKVDTKRLKAEQSKIYDQYSYTTPTRYFILKGEKK